MPNPLLPDLLALLRQHPQGLSEHALLAELADHALFNGQDRHRPLDLFRQHFLVMNGLYQLQEQLWRESEDYLDITPLLIQIRPANGGGSRQPSSGESAALREYYLDEQQLLDTDEDSVCDLLASFWNQFNNREGRGRALELMELAEDADTEQITQRYRLLVARHHPDKGGDPESFIRIRQAYELLMSAH